MHYGPHPYFALILICSTYSFEAVSNEPLFVTYRLNSNIPIEDIRKEASVPLFENAYSGLITVDATCNSNLFFMFIKSTENSSGNPLVLWMQGGPGETIFNAVLGTNGPYRVVNGSLVPSSIAWTKEFNMLYVDNPVGAAYSFTDKWSCNSRTVEEAMDNVYEALRQFYILFPEYVGNELYLAGESYAGKYVATLANLINDKNQNQSVEINVRGLFVGVGYLDPQNQLYYADSLFEHSVVNATDRDQIRDLETEARENIKKGRHYTAFTKLFRIAYIVYRNGYWPPIDLTDPHPDTSSQEGIRKYIRRKHFRDAIHTGSLKLHDRKWTIMHFRDDFLNSVSHYLSKAVARHNKVLLYSGEHDMLIPSVQIDRVISNLEWDGLRQFQNIEQSPWFVRNELAGYVKSWQNLTQVRLKDANHYCIQSQPNWVYELFRSFVRGTL